MEIFSLDEPELEFCGGNHIDIRFGLMQYGPLDRHTELSPTMIRVGIVGTEETAASVREWLERSSLGVSAKRTHLSNLFPPFPGFSSTSCFGSDLVFHEKWIAKIRKREILDIVSISDPKDLLDQTVDLFLGYASDITQPGGPSVLIVAPPGELLSVLDYGPDRSDDTLEDELDEGSESEPWHKGFQSSPCFHDVLKARGMSLGVPIQMIRPETYGTTTLRKKGRRRRPEKPRLQDEATRAWNLFTALYYKAGGSLWRLIRDPSEYSACYMGISFYRSLDRDRVLTSVAQVFNERGEGIIVRGANALLGKDDKQPHLSKDDSFEIVTRAISTYRREHRTIPARVVIHKTSISNEAEKQGFNAAIDHEKIEMLDLLSLRRSYSRLFRIGTFPPIRGTVLKLDETTGLIYLRGSVPFFTSYPGLYVPRPIEFKITASNSGVSTLAKEILDLSKLNWNNTQFDGGEPITVRAARRVGDILKCVPSDASFQPSFRFFI